MTKLQLMDAFKQREGGFWETAFKDCSPEMAGRVAAAYRQSIEDFRLFYFRELHDQPHA